MSRKVEDLIRELQQELIDMSVEAILCLESGQSTALARWQ